MEEHFRQIIRATGDDLDREGLAETPRRAAAAFQYLTRGYSQTVEQVVGRGVFKSDTDEMVVVKNIELYSLCEHHMLPFLGKCHVGYLPNGKILGLSKVARIVDVFARRLQIQEELTRQVANSIQELLGAGGVGVVVEARHLCMMMRGVEKQNSEMTTSCMLGEFRSNGQTRSEFLSLISD
jgi:GTP cyclohydrolase I